MPKRVKPLPEHGTIVVVDVPASTQRRRWCGICHIWTWEAGGMGTGVWRHGRRTRTSECQARGSRDA